MKIVGIVLVMVGCTLMGLLVDAKQKNRLMELKTLIDCFEMLKGEIDYRLSPIGEACSYVGSRGKGTVCNIFLLFAKELETMRTADIDQVWKEVLGSQKEKFHLKDTDYEVLGDFGLTLGSIDKQMQKRTIEMLLLKLQQIVVEGEEAYVKNAKLNRSLGMLIGLCISIVLI